MRPVATFTVAPVFPENLSRLNQLYENLYWTWNPTIRECLRSIDPGLWHDTNHNPLMMLQRLPAGQLDALAADEAFLERYRDALRELDEYLNAGTWYKGKREGQQETIAYLSAEFGIHESVPLYSGGLGILSGDHTKSASDLGLPFVCVGLMYQMGYFRQRLTIDGVQLETYDLNSASTLPLQEVTNPDGTPMTITVEYPKGPVVAHLWRLDVGRVPIYLLDTNVAENTVAEYRDIAGVLYGGDSETRIMQEIMLGIGGFRALKAVGIEPTVTHSNEGHSAFLMLERIRTLMAELGLGFAEAAELTAAGSVFTTHTPVPAGNDVFDADMMEKYFKEYWPQLGLSRDEFLSLGRLNPADASEAFSMTVLALKLASKRNGVSQLHGDVSRAMWSRIWSNLPRAEAPIDGITNGVHTHTWAADTVGKLFTRHMGRAWRTTIGDEGTWKKVSAIPDGEFWQVKQGLRREMINYIHTRLDEQQSEWFTRSTQGRAPERILDPEILTIGFARRFATYKRATLLFRDEERALRLFGDPDRPIQLVIAGKAHPKDTPGKEFIRKVIEFIRDNKLEGRIVYVEDYDMAVARRITQGCDVWLNTPRRPLEASGTSGMKAAINGTINLSILDGWFPEGYDGTNAFAIGAGEEFSDPENQDEFESRKLYHMLEEHVIPAFYNRNEAGVPERWVAIQKRALETMVGQFSADRMVREYAERFYFTCSDRYRHLRAERGAKTRELIGWKRFVAQNWNDVAFDGVNVEGTSASQVGQEVRVTARLQPGRLAPNDLLVQAYYGPVDPEGMVSNGMALPMQATGTDDKGLIVYSGTVRLASPGHAGIAVRVIPHHPDLVSPADMNMVKWG